MTASDKTIAPLSGLRVIAAGLVFFYHWFFTHASSWPIVARAPFDVGYVGVPIFFALSGFLISLRYTPKLADRRVTYWQYWLNRFARIYPLYFFVLTAFVAIPQKGITLTDTRAILVAYTLTQAFFPSLLLAGVAVGWTLTLELIFYFCAPGIFAWLNSATSNRQLVAMAVGLSVVALGAAWVVASIPLPSAWVGSVLGAPLDWVLHYSILGHLPDFMVGTVAGLLFLRGNSKLTGGLVLHLLIGGGILGLYGCMLGLDTVATELGSPLNRLLGIGVAFCVGLVIFGLACDNRQSNPISKWLGAPWMVYLGGVSYALYLIQLTEPCQWLFWILLGEKLGVSDLIVRALLLYIMASVLAAILYHVIERPAEKWLRALANRRPAAITQPGN